MKKGGLLLIAVSLILAFGLFATGATLSGSLKNDLTLTPRGDDFFSSNSKLTRSILNVKYSVDGLTLNSKTVFDIDGLSGQVFKFNTSLGKLGLSSKIKFDPEKNELALWKGSAFISLDGLSLSDTLLLKNSGSKYSAGMALSLSGSTPGGVNYDVTNKFGEASGASDFGYVNTVMKLSGLSLGCVDFNNKTKFSANSGFNWSKFSFYINPEDLPLTFGSTVSFSEDKSIKINPSLDLDWSCFNVYTKIGPKLDENSSKLDSLIFKGFSLRTEVVENVYFGTYTALGDYNVHNINRHLKGSYSYEVGGTTRKLTFHEAFIFDVRNDLKLDLDIYFGDSSEGKSLFEFRMFTGSMSYPVSDQFTLGSSMYMLEDVGLDRLSFSLDYSF